MGRHVPRKARWSRLGPNEHRSAEGRVYYRAGQWHAAVTYQLSGPEPVWPEGPQSWALGHFKRPRNAMMAVEDKVLELRRRYGDGVVFLL
jgi:hypothetical protein